MDSKKKIKKKNKKKKKKKKQKKKNKKKNKKKTKNLSLSWGGPFRGLRDKYQSMPALGESPLDCPLADLGKPTPPRFFDVHRLTLYFIYIELLRYMILYIILHDNSYILFVSLHDSWELISCAQF